VPLYEYECLKCGRRTERIENHKGPHLRKCPFCAGKVERLISRSAIQFKGGGWYVSDYGRKSGPSSDGRADKGVSKPAAEPKAAKETSSSSEKTSAKKD